jgi:hypothetical protein
LNLHFPPSHLILYSIAFYGARVIFMHAQGLSSVTSIMARYVDNSKHQDCTIFHYCCCYLKFLSMQIIGNLFLLGSLFRSPLIYCGFGFPNLRIIVSDIIAFRMCLCFDRRFWKSHDNIYSWEYLV